MWVRRITKSVTVREKEFHACNNSEMLTKTETILVCIEMIAALTKIKQTTTCSAPVGLASCLHFGECAKWVGSHACAQ